NAEPLRCDGSRRTVPEPVVPALAHLGRGLRRGTGVRLPRRLQPVEHELAQRRRVQRDRPAGLAPDPARRQRQRRLSGDEDVAVDAVAAVAVLALRPPRRVGSELDASVADDVSELPLRLAAELLDVEALRNAEVALAAGREPDVGADPRDAELLDDLVLL